MKAIRKNKALIAALLLSAMLTLFGGVTAIAAETADGTYETKIAENATRSTLMDGESVELSDESDGIKENGDAMDDSSAEESDTGKNALEGIYDTVKEYATEIFSSLAFAGTVIVAFIYKKGLVPVITRTSGAISTLVSKLRDENAAGQKNANEKLRLATEQLSSLEGDISDVASALCTVTERLAGCETLEREQKRIADVMKAQVDMLYAIFMSSALPQYQKDEVGERISAMKKELECYDTVEEKH